MFFWWDVIYVADLLCFCGSLLFDGLRIGCSGDGARPVDVVGEIIIVASLDCSLLR